MLGSSNILVSACSSKKKKNVAQRKNAELCMIKAYRRHKSMCTHSTQAWLFAQNIMRYLLFCLFGVHRRVSLERCLRLCSHSLSAIAPCVTVCSPTRPLYFLHLSGLMIAQNHICLTHNVESFVAIRSMHHVVTGAPSPLLSVDKETIAIASNMKTAHCGKPHTHGKIYRWFSCQNIGRWSFLRALRNKSKNKCFSLKGNFGLSYFTAN